MAGAPARWDLEADVVSIGSGLGGLFFMAQLLQIGHDVAHGGRGQVDAVATGERARADRLTGR